MHQMGSLPIQALLVAAEPTLITTQTAHDVRVYTKTSGMYVAHVQHARSNLRAHRRTTTIFLDISDSRAE